MYTVPPSPMCNLLYILSIYYCLNVLLHISTHDFQCVFSVLQERRIEKKLNRSAFKDEKKRQEKIMQNNKYNYKISLM